MLTPRRLPVENRKHRAGISPTALTRDGGLAAAVAARPGWFERWWGVGVVGLCLLVYYLTRSTSGNTYLHFVLQAQAWLEGRTAIPTPGYQDVMPILNAAGASSGFGIIPFPPLPAWALLPFVFLWGAATDEKSLAVLFAALDVALAYWMLGYLAVRPAVRVLAALFFGLGTVLWYAAAIGSTWFFAHLVAVAPLLLSLGVALAADRSSIEPEPVGDAFRAVRHTVLPGGLSSLTLLIALGVVGESLFLLASSGTPAAALAAIGVILCLLFAALAVAVAGRPGVLGPFALAAVIGGGLTVILLAAAQSAAAIELIDAILALAALSLAVLWRPDRNRTGRIDQGLAAIWPALSSPEALQVAAGILFGLAVTARLTILFGAPFFLFVGGGGTWIRRGLLAGAGAAVPLVTLLLVTYATSGHLFNPAYDYLYHVELGEGVFAYNAGWSITDIRYIPQNLVIMLFELPKIAPDAYSIFPNGFASTALCQTGSARGLFATSCPLAMPDAIGTSILLTSPAYLLAPLAWRPLRGLKLDRATVGATVAVAGIALVNLMHFSQGWVQFGYRFSNDFAPFALILVALGASRLGRLWPVVLLVAFSVAVNFWGTTWGVRLGW